MVADEPTLVLASASPRRLDLLRLAGFEPVVRAVEVDESVAASEPPPVYVARLARTKGEAVARAPGEVVVAADTTVVVDDEPIGKPDDDRHAAEMLRRLAGRAHEVLTGVAVLDDDRGVTELVVRTTVVFAALDDREIRRYVDTGEPAGKAGAYAIQGVGATLVERIDGSWTNVVGLPVVETVALLRAAGLRPAVTPPRAADVR